MSEEIKDDSTLGLKPCPFCGGPASTFAFPFIGWYAQCRMCGAKIGRLQNEQAQAVEIWNKRNTTEQ